MILLVNKEMSELEKVDETSSIDLDIWERMHIQEWIRETS